MRRLKGLLGIGPFVVKYTLAVGSAEFWAAAAADIANARRRVLVQAMTFEADAAGRAVFDSVAASAAVDRRILVDSYSRMVVNDTFVTSPALLLDRAFRAEVIATRRMFSEGPAKGVAVRRTNPVGRNPVRYGVRNHKKLIVTDDVAWIGGINFSEHNFAWRDMMLRIEGGWAPEFLAEDFAATWDARQAPSGATRDGLTLLALDGRSNADGYEPLFAAIEGAQRSISLLSAYPTFPFLDRLEAAARRGIAVEIITPRDTNKPIVRNALLARAAVPGMTVRLTPGMSHLKAMLIDDAVLATGSTNFDFASFIANEEYLALLSDPAIVADFTARVLQPARAAAVDRASLRPARWRGASATAGLRIAAAAIAPLARARRTTREWD